MINFNRNRKSNKKSMKGCKYNCIVKSVVPENMIEPLNEIFQEELAVKVNDRQWFHVFNREHCLTLSELLEFRKNQLIDIQNGQITLLMMKLIEKFISIMSHKVVHGNLTFDNVWIINTAGFWPHNQQHNYKIVFVNYQGGLDNNILQFKDILLALNDIIRPRDKERIDIIFLQQQDRLKSNLLKLYGDLFGSLDMKTQTIPGWFQEISIKNKYKTFLDPNIFLKNLPLNNNQMQSNEDQQFNCLLLEECRRIIIKKMQQGLNRRRDRETINLKILTQISKQIQLKEDIIQFMKQRERERVQQEINERHRQNQINNQTGLL